MSRNSRAFMCFSAFVSPATDRMDSPGRSTISNCDTNQPSLLSLRAPTHPSPPVPFQGCPLLPSYCLSLQFWAARLPFLLSRPTSATARQCLVTPTQPSLPSNFKSAPQPAVPTAYPQF